MIIEDSIFEFEGKRYKMTFDYHSHTIFSHGLGNIYENVMMARKKGLKAIAISDHGPGHLTYGIKRSDIKIMREEISRLNNQFDDIKVYLSVEANLVDTENGLDIGRNEIDDYDFIIAGYHFGVAKGRCLEKMTLRKGFGGEKRRSKLMKFNTDIALRAIYENSIKILTHPGDKAPFDMEALAKACSDRGTWMEISTHHKHLTVDEIKLAAKYDVKFVISSDAHIPRRVGTFHGGMKRAIEAGIDLERIVNIELV